MDYIWSSRIHSRACWR